MQVNVDKGYLRIVLKMAESHITESCNLYNKTTNEEAREVLSSIINTSIISLREVAREAGIEGINQFKLPGE